LNNQAVFRGWARVLKKSNVCPSWGRPFGFPYREYQLLTNPAFAPTANALILVSRWPTATTVGTFGTLVPTAYRQHQARDCGGSPKV